MDGTHEIDIFGKVFSLTLCLCVCESGGEGREGERRCQKGGLQDKDNEHFSCISLNTYERCKEEYRSIYTYIYIYMCVCIYIYIYFFFFGISRAICRILVPQPEIELISPALGAQGLNHWTSREVPRLFLLAAWE